MTIKEIANIIADGMDRPFDGLLIERIKRLIILTYNDLMREQIDKYRYDNSFRIFYKVTDLIQVSSTDTDNNLGVTILRTRNKIPSPVRIKRPQPFYYVGSVDGTNAFVYTEYALLFSIKYLPLIATGVRYYYRDGYIYIYNNLLLEEIAIDSAFESLLINPSDEESGSGIHITADMEFPAPLDVVSKIIEILPKRYFTAVDINNDVESGHKDNN